MKRSFADYENRARLACFSDKNDKRPHEIAFWSRKKYIFKCDVCHHEIHQQIVGVTSGKAWCGFCANRRLCPLEEDCLVCYQKTFAHHSPEKALCWNYEKNTLWPDEVVYGSGSKFWFTCSKCKHDFQQTLDKVTRKDNRWCAFCYNFRLCPVPRDCSTCFQKTFAGKYPEKARCWSETRNKLRADQVVFGSRSKFWFKCDECEHEFRMGLDSIKTKGLWCPECACNNTSKIVRALTQTLSSFADVKFTKEETVRCNKRPLRWDFVVSNANKPFWIEADGTQHFTLREMMGIMRTKNVAKAKARFSDQRRRDLLKEEHIRKIDGLLFRVSYKQLKEIEILVKEMIEKSNAGVTGVVYMDKELYKDWGPIVYAEE